ncbi:YkvA family protein, partial [Chryseobacterium indologenes]|uniref:YkvA family protein n=2 Tax=Chryseobacterium group TaxID=2782232 RepID=UPI00338F8309
KFIVLKSLFKSEHKMKYSKLNLAKEAINHKGFIKKIPDIFRMVKMWRKGIYPMRSIDIILPLLGILYVISPIDLLPEFAIPVLGVMDDLAVLSLTIPKLIKEVDKFLLWEAERKYSGTQVIDAEIIK